MSVALAITHHDPEGRLNRQLEQHLNHVAQMFVGIAVQASPESDQHGLDQLSTTGAAIEMQSRAFVGGMVQIGQVRRAVIEQALAFDTPHVMYCDGDRLLHWIERYPDELETVLGKIQQADFTVLGRTKRAFDSHSKVQCDTERIINHAFSLMSGQEWDITAAARGLSRQAVNIIVNECSDDSFGVDGTWPLTIQNHPSLSSQCVETEGLEFETPDQFPAEIAEMGGIHPWMDSLDQSIPAWITRLKLASVEVEAMAAISDNIIP